MRRLVQPACQKAFSYTLGSRETDLNLPTKTRRLVVSRATGDQTPVRQ